MYKHCPRFCNCFSHTESSKVRLSCDAVKVAWLKSALAFGAKTCMIVIFGSYHLQKVD